MALDDHFNPSNLAGRIVRTPPLPVAGFWSRLLAFGLDWIILRFAFYGLALVAREPLLSLGPWAARLSALLMFAYFWLGDGPVGKGRTLGKWIFSLRVIQAEDGAVLSYKRAALRAIVLFPTIVWANYFILPTTLPFPDTPATLWAAILLSLGVFLSLYLAQLIHTAFNPTRQGFHDVAAHSLVIGAEHDETTWEKLQEIAGMAGMQRVRRAHHSGMITLLATLVLFGFYTHREVRSPSDPKDREGVRELNTILVAKNLKLEFRPYATPLSEEEVAKQGGERPTTPTLALDPEGPPRRVEILLLRAGKETRSPAEARAEIAEIAQWIHRYLHEKAERTSNPLPAGSILSFIYQEYLDLVIYKQGFEVLREERPW